MTHSALVYMHLISRKTGETCARKLARAVVKLGSVPNVGNEKSRVERLARKYTKRRDTMEWHGPNMRLCEPDAEDRSPLQTTSTRPERPAFVRTAPRREARKINRHI